MIESTFNRTACVRVYRAFNVLALLCLLLSACATAPVETVNSTHSTSSWSIDRVVQTDRGMITLFDPYDLAHHEAEPDNWFMYDFAIRDDLQSGRLAAVLTSRPGSYKLRITFGGLTEQEQLAAGPVAVLRQRVINRRLLLSGGEAWPSINTSHKQFASDPRWLSMPNGDYKVIITALDPSKNLSDYVFQLIRIEDMKTVEHAPALPQLVYGSPAGVVGYNAKGFSYSERCSGLPDKALWVPLNSSTMPLPGAVETVELPRYIQSGITMHKRSASSGGMPIVLARNPKVGLYGYYISPSMAAGNYTRNSSSVLVKTLVRCVVKITDVVVQPELFEVKIKAVPTPLGRLSQHERTSLIDEFISWMTYTGDPAWHFKSEMVRRSDSDGAMVLGVLQYLNLSAKESEVLLPMSNALRADYLLDRLRDVTGANQQ